MTGNQEKVENVGNERISENCGPQKDPLMIDLILDSVFFFCDLNTLKNCRFVNNRWKKLSLPFWAKKLAEIVISPDFSEMPLVDRSFKFGKVFNLIDSYTGDNIISNYPSLQKIKLNRGLITDESLVIDLFWKRCGQWMKQLNLENCIIQSESMLYAILTSKFTPVLETLLWKNVRLPGGLTESLGRSGIASCTNPKMRLISITQSIVHYDNAFQDDVHPAFPISWRFILSHYPNLKNFQKEIENYKKANFFELTKDAKDLISAMVKLRKDDKFELFLDSFEMGTFPRFLNSATLELLKKANLPFSKFYVEWTKTSSSEGLHDLLEIHSKSLKKLKIDMDNWLENEVVPFYTGVLPRMELVTELNLGLKLFQNFNFLRFFPKLESLFLEDVDNIDEMVGETDDDKEEGMLLKFLKRIRIKNDSEAYCGVLSIQKFTSWMPNVTMVNMNITKDAFPLVCQGWKNLEHIDLPGSRNQIDDDILADIFKLPELKTFIMNPGRTNGQEKLTVKSISEGFSKLQLLKELRLCMAPGFNPQDEILLTLRPNLQAEFYYIGSNGLINFHAQGQNEHKFTHKYLNSFMN